MSTDNAIALRNTIRNNNDLRLLREQLKAALTLTTVSTLFSRVVKDDSTADAVARAVGKKGDKTIKQREVDMLAATMLGFANPHEMFQHYQIPYFDVQIFRHMGEHDECRQYLAVEQGVNPTVLDMCYQYGDEDGSFHFDFHEELNEFEYVADSLTDKPKDVAVENASYLLTRHSATTGLAFDFSAHTLESWREAYGKCHRCPSEQADHHTAALGWMVESGGCGISFPVMGESMLAPMTSQHVAIVGVETCLMGAPQRVMQMLGEALLSSFPERVVSLGGDERLQMLLASTVGRSRMDTVTLGRDGDLQVRVDIPRGVLLFEVIGDQHVMPALGVGLYMDAHDIRFAPYIDAIKA